MGSNITLAEFKIKNVSMALGEELFQNLVGKEFHYVPIQHGQTIGVNLEVADLNSNDSPPIFYVKTLIAGDEPLATRNLTITLRDESILRASMLRRILEGEIDRSVVEPPAIDFNDILNMMYIRKKYYSEIFSKQQIKAISKEFIAYVFGDTQQILRKVKEMPSLKEKGYREIPAKYTYSSDDTFNIIPGEFEILEKNNMIAPQCFKPAAIDSFKQTDIFDENQRDYISWFKGLPNYGDIIPERPQYDVLSDLGFKSKRRTFNQIGAFEGIFEDVDDGELRIKF